MTIDKLQPDERLRALRYFFGWPDATIERIAAATGCSAIDLIERGHGSAGTGSGFSAVRTCNLPWRRDYLAARHQGEFLYWRDVMNGFWVTGALDQKVGALSK